MASPVILLGSALLACSASAGLVLLLYTSSPSSRGRLGSLGSRKQGQGQGQGRASQPGPWKRAYNSWYTSYAPCCKENPNYSPSASKGECEDYSACKYSGMFAFGGGKKSYDWVKSNNIVAFFDKSAKGAGSMAGKQIELRKNGKVFRATVLDTCGDADCNSCCSKNAAETGYLVDIEKNTCIRELGSAKHCSGEIEWRSV